MLCQASQAVTVSLKAVPAVCSAGVGRLKLVALAALTVKEPDVPSTVVAPSFALSVVLWASNSLIDAVPTPAANVTVAGYSGAVTFGAFAGPLQVSVFAPV